MSEKEEWSDPTFEKRLDARQDEKSVSGGER
jgi:hypothetical protein